MTDSPTSPTPELTTWHYSHGQWTEGPDFVMQAWPEGEDDSVAMARLGYKKIHTVGDANIPPAIEVWERNASPRFVLSLETGTIHYVYADTVPDMWDLLARWSPVVRDDMITTLMSDLNKPEAGNLGVVETIARRISWGSQQPYDDPTQRRRPQ
jgi:hypothetical protein